MLQLASASLTFDGFDNLDFINTFAIAKKAGYDCIEFNCWYPETLAPQHILRLRRRCEAAGIQPIALQVGSIGGGDRDASTMNLCHKLYCIQAATQLGCRRVVFTGMERGKGGGMPAILEVLEQLIPAAEQADVLICLENHCANNLETMEDYQTIMDRFSSPHLGVCIDTGHFDASGIHPIEVLECYGSRVLHIHLKENNGFGKKQFCRFGEGTTDNNSIIRKAREMDYNGYFTVEISPEISENGDSTKFVMTDFQKPVQLLSRVLCGEV